MVEQHHISFVDHGVVARQHQPIEAQPGVVHPQIKCEAEYGGNFLVVGLASTLEQLAGEHHGEAGDRSADVLQGDHGRYDPALAHSRWHAQELAVRIIVDGGDGSGELVVVHGQIDLLEHCSHLLLLAEELAELLQVERHLHLSQLVSDTRTVQQLRSYLVLLRLGTDLRELLLVFPLNRSHGLLARELQLRELLLESRILTLLCYQIVRHLALSFL